MESSIIDLKKQCISSVMEIGENVIIKTQNFEITIPKNNINQIKKFEQYPKILEHNTFNFDGYVIIDRVIQKSLRINDFNAFIYFPKIEFSFGDESDLRKQNILKLTSNKEFTYVEITNDIDCRDFFKFLVNNIKTLNNIDINILNEVCRKFCETSFKNATFKPNDIYSAYTVRETKNGFSFNNNISHYSHDLKIGKNF